VRGRRRLSGHSEGSALYSMSRRVEGVGVAWRCFSRRQMGGRGLEEMLRRR